MGSPPWQCMGTIWKAFVFFHSVVPFHSIQQFVGAVSEPANRRHNHLLLATTRRPLVGGTHADGRAWSLISLPARLL